MKTSEIAEFLNGQLIGQGDTEILRVASLDIAGKNEISFVEKSDSFSQTNADCLLVP